MEDDTVTINCDNCGNPINVNEVLSKQLEKQLIEQFETKHKKGAERIKRLEESLAVEKVAIEKQAEELKASIESGVQKRLKTEREKLTADIRERVLEETAEQTSIMEKELQDKSEKVKELNKSKAEIAKLIREKAELKSETNAEAEKKLNETLVIEREKIIKTEKERNELKLMELAKQLEDQKNLTEEMKRKQEQGSMQLQGEVQELAIEEWLTSEFPLDTIEEIKKGAKGADCLQTVNTRTHRNCGTIYYESKRTKSFQPLWVEKFKGDMRDKGAGVGILVTEAMPIDMDRAGQKEGVWICNFDEFKALSKVLRESVIQVSNALISQDNKGDKMEILYQYLTGNEFRLQIEAIVEGFSQMKTDLESEKRSFQRIWKQREKQIEKVTTNTIEMYGSIKGIAGNAIQSVKQLELSEFVEN